MRQSLLMQITIKRHIYVSTVTEWK